MANKRGWLVFFYVLFVLCCFYPYEFYSTYLLMLVPNQATYFSFAIVAITIVLLFVVKKVNYNKALVYVAIMQMIGFVMVAMVQGGMGTLSSPFVRMVLAILLVILIDGSKEGLVGFYNKYNKWILIMAVLGTVTWVLATFVGFQPLSAFIERAGGTTMYNYGLTFTKSDMTYTGMIRYAGFFDEPGAMAYWGMYALIINKLFIKNGRVELFLIICLLFTFSLGFYFQVVVYLLFFSIGKNSKFTWLSIFAVSILVLLLVNNVSSNSVLYEKTFGRITETFTESQESGSIFATGNRAEYTENAKRQFLENPIFGAKSGEEAIGNNIYENLANYGVLGCLFILFPYLYIFILAFNNKDKELLKCALIILLGFTHRPFHNALLYYFIMYSIIAMYLTTRKNRALVTS